MSWIGGCPVRDYQTHHFGHQGTIVNIALKMHVAADGPNVVLPLFWLCCHGRLRLMAENLFS